MPGRQRTRWMYGQSRRRNAPPALFDKALPSALGEVAPLSALEGAFFLPLLEG